MAAESTTAQATGEVTVVRVFDAPREAVWRAWTEPALFAQWFRTPPFRTPESSVAMDVRPGGEWRATQVSDEDGTELPFVGRYRAVVMPERLVFTFEDPENRDDPKVEVVTVTLQDAAGKTEMVLRQQGHLPAEQYEKLKEGYGRFFDQLAKLLATGVTFDRTYFAMPDDRPVIVIRRTFDAPRHEVWEALTKPEYVERWYGPARYKVEVPELDLRPGGRWRFLNIDADGTVYGFHGEYLEVVPEERLVQTWVFEGTPDEVVVETAELTEHDGRTEFVATAEYPSFESRAGILGAGGNEGAAESYRRLDELLASMG